MSSRFFISDTHFGHENIIKLADRPFKTVEEMAMIANWNSVVKPNDEVYHLGDFSYRASGIEYLETTFRRLRGRKHLVLGNHDGVDSTRLPWASVGSHYRGRAGKIRVHLMHYPMREWDGYWRGTVHLHGHTHGTLPDIPGSMDVGVERLNYTPIELGEVTARFTEWSNNSQGKRPAWDANMEKAR